MAPPYNAAATWLTIWPQPRQAIQAYVDNSDDRELHVLVPALLLSSIHLIAPNVAFWHAHNNRGALYLALIAFIGVAIAQAALWLYTGILWRVGRAAGGGADHRAVFAAYVWSRVPWLAGGLLCIPHDTVLELRDQWPGPTAWMPSVGRTTPAADALWIAGAALIAFSWVMHLRCQSQVQGYGVWRALFVDLLIAAGALVILAPILIVSLKLL